MIKSDSERKSALQSCASAETAMKDARQAEAPKYTTNSWDKAVQLMDEANNKFELKDFMAASGLFSNAKEQFEKCTGEAKQERDRHDAVEKVRSEARELHDMVEAQLCATP